MSDNIITLNQTTIHAWASGQYQKAVEHYFKLANFTTEAMADGTALHKKWSEHINLAKTLPLEFGGKPLTNPLPERKYVVQLLPLVRRIVLIAQQAMNLRVAPKVVKHMQAVGKRAFTRS